VGALEHLTGPSRGSVTWLTEASVDVVLTPGRHLRVAEPRPEQQRKGSIARLERIDGSYVVEPAEGQPIWVNGAPAGRQQLRHLDMIEFGENGPVSRFRLYGEAQPSRKTLGEIFADCLAYLRVSRQPLGRRLIRAARELLRELTVATTLLFRLMVLLALAGFALLAWRQYELNLTVRQSLEAGASRVDSIAAALSRTRDEALQPGDLAALRDELGQRMTSNVERLEALERRSKAVARVIADSMHSVALLQVSFGFQDVSTGRRLRHVVTLTGVPLISPRGQPLLTLDGDGPVAELQVIGTAFLVGSQGALITNRHVALPWEDEAGAQVMSSGDLQPVMTRFIAYLPGRPDPVAVETLLASDTDDLAILKLTGTEVPTPGLSLAEAPPDAGESVIVMGYPTGLRSLLAQSGAAFVAELQATENTDFWQVAKRLAEEGYIVPLASSGIVGHSTAEAIVYDAETTHGGSGGPVLDSDGAVVAVNTAILPEFGGSNLGIPAAKVRTLLEQAGLQ
jgi:S1-C subfamily serine protease